MKPGTLFFTIAAFGIATGFAYFNFINQPQMTPEQQASAHPTKADTTTRSDVLTKAQLDTLEKISKEINADIQLEGSLSRDEKDFEISSLEFELEHALLEEAASPWTIGDIESSSDSIILNDKIQTKEPITFNPEESAAVSVGDVISLSLPGANQYQAVVDHVTISANGETNWTGYIEGESTDYPVIFTIGATNSFATITTPLGLYAMEAVNRSGWVYKTPDLVDLVDPDQPDHLVIDQ